MARQLLVLILAVLSTSVNCTLYEHTGAVIDVNVGRETVINLGQKFRYVGRHFFNITLVPRWGCVSFGVLPKNLDSVITFENIQEYPLVCPLFSQHAGAPTSGYQFKFEEFGNTSALAEKIQKDITEVTEIFVDYTPKVKRGVLVTWINAPRKSDEGSGSGLFEAEDPSSSESETNTYQVAIVFVSAEDVVENAGAARPDYTFAVFNYDQVQWTGWTARNDSNLRGLAGMVYGDNKGVQSLPFARNEDEIKNYLPKKSSIVGIEGRYIYDITNVPQRMGCLDVLDFPPAINQPEILTTSVTTADIFGGTIVRIQGQCRPGEGYPPVRCGFVDVDEDDSPVWRNEIGVYLSNYTLVCLTPRLELGRSKIAMSSPPPFTSYPFQADFYVTAPTVDTALIKINYNSLYSENTAENITLEWNPELFGRDQKHRLNITIEAFKSTSFDTIKSTSFYVGEIAADSGYFNISVKDVQCKAGASENEEEKCDGFLIGYFKMLIKDYADAPINPYVTKRTAISSIPIPIGWYVRDYHRSKYGSSWYLRYCNQPVEPVSTPRCPCSRAMARYDTRQFVPAPDCGRDQRGSTCLLQADDSYCYNAVSDTKASVRCCYDSSGNLIDGSINPVVGSHKLSFFPFVNFREFGVPGARTYLSYYLSHVKNHYACCGAPGLGANKTPNCAAFATKAQTPSRCFDHVASSLTGIAGDPHFKLPDNQTYSFNGVGDYWYAFSRDDDLVKIQIRLAIATSRYSTNSSYQVAATILKAVAIKFQSTVIQVQVQPLTYLDDPTLSTKRLMIIINGREEFWTNDEQIRFYEGFRIASSGENQDRFHITLLDGGALVACDYIETVDADEPVSPGSMNCRISYSTGQQSEINGLIGTLLNGRFALVDRTNWNVAINLTNPTDVFAGGKSWQVKKDETFMRYLGTSWETVNSETNSFTPVLGTPPNFINGDETEELKTCGPKTDRHFSQCSYDYRITGSKVLAAQTKVHLDQNDQLTEVFTEEQQYCDSLNIPFAIVNTTNGNKVGSIAEVKSCVRNYVPRSSYTFPQSLTCIKTTDGYAWTGNKVDCIRTGMYDYWAAKELENPYSSTSLSALGVTNFSASYLGRAVKFVLLYPPSGCIFLSDYVEPGTEPRICPLLAAHANSSANPSFDTYKFLYEVVASTDTDKLNLIQEDILRAGGSFDSSVSGDNVHMAFIFTWLDVPFNGAKCSDAQTCNALLRNTYQVVLAISEKGKTYVMINYEKIQWSGLESPGLEPTLYSAAGFYFGDRKGNLQLPYSNVTTEEFKKLISLSTDQLVTGRYTFEVSGVGNPKRLGCYKLDAELPRSTELLTINDELVDIYGSNVVRIQGACLTDRSKLKCGFERTTSSGAKQWHVTQLYVRDPNTGVCVTPSLPDIDVGWTRIGLSLDSGVTFKYVNDIYFGTDFNGGPFAQLSTYSPTENFWLLTQPNNTIRVSWSGAFGFTESESSQVELLIIGYDSTGKAIEFQQIAVANSTDDSIQFHSSEKQCTGSTCNGVLIGRFVVRIAQSSLQNVLETTNAHLAAVSSVLMPIGWYTNQYHTSLSNNAQWYGQFCEPSADPIVVQSVPQCPCLRDFVESEQRLFFKAPDCVRKSGQSSCLFSPTAADCYTTLPTARGHSIRCCYDKTGNLIPSTASALDGAYLLPYAVNTNEQIFNIIGSNTQLSYQLSHVKNYFACCSVDLLQRKTLSGNCNSLSYKRTVSKTCDGFAYSGWSDVVGDPHFYTTDGARYTFNGVGEYWYVFSRESDFPAKIQLRFVQAVNSDATFAKATVLSAVAFDFMNSKVEIHVQPWSFRNAGNKYLMVLINGREQYFQSTHEMFHRNFKIVSNDNQDYVSVTAQKNGPLIHCSYKYADHPNFNGMFCSFSLPKQYKYLVFGLSGYWDDLANNDLVPRDKIYGINFGSVNTTDIEAVHKNFSLSWAVPQSESLFTYFDTDWEYYNQNAYTFIPELNFPPNYGYITSEQVLATCGAGRINFNQCQYDYEMTNSSFYAAATVAELDRVSLLRNNLIAAGEPTCNYLDLPYATISYANGIAVGATAQVTGCSPGYDVVSGAPSVFVCIKNEGSSPSWSPAPKNYCRDKRKLYGEIYSGITIDPSSPVLPEITLPSLPSRAVNGIRFGGRPVNGFSLVSSTGCVAMKLNVTKVQIGGFPDRNNDDVPMICPLFASHSTLITSSVDTYSIQFVHLTGQDASLTELTNDIKTVSEGFNNDLDELAVTDAYVFTWIDARSSTDNCESSTSCLTPKRNSYELVVAVTNNLATYAIITYAKLEWSGLTNSSGATIQSYGALHYGENRGTVKLPYAGKPSELSRLVSGGTLRNLAGRYFYRVDDRFERVGCFESTVGSADEKLPVTLNSYVADVYGGRRLVLQSVCLPSSVSSWTCGFSKNTAAGYPATTKLYRLNEYTAACQAPHLPDMDVGETFLGISDGSNYLNYESTIYLDGAIKDQTPVNLEDNLVWFSATSTKNMTVSWNPAWFPENAELKVLLIGYKESSGKFSKQEYPLGVAFAGEGAFVFDATENICNSNCEGTLIGQVALRVANESAILNPSYEYLELSSTLVPIGWYVNNWYVNNKKKANWYEDYCDTSVVTAPLQCPCTSIIAQSDYRSFIPTPLCNSLYGSECLITPEASSCYTTLPLNNNGAGLLCCYTSAGNLIYSQEKPLSGSYALKYAPTARASSGVSGATGYLSYYYSHPKNLFACCSANATNVANKLCYDYIQSRTVETTCSKFESSGASGIIGDPHILTTDGSIYTFNGVGEYWWVTDGDSSLAQRAMRVQVRFQNRFKSYLTSAPTVPLRATLLTSLVLHFDGTEIQIEVQGPSYLYGNGRKLALYVDGVEKFFYDYPTVQYFQGARVFSQRLHEFIRVSTPYNGATVECMYAALYESTEVGSMTCIVIMPRSYQGKVYGLSGRWDGNPSNDLVARENVANPITSTNPNDMAAVHTFGKTWRVLAKESWFDYFGTSFEETNREIDTFVPELTLTPSSPLNDSTINFACTPGRRFSERCGYDYRITTSRNLALNTINALGGVANLQTFLATDDSEYCPWINIPFALVSTTTGVKLGSAASVVRCINGYQLNAAIRPPTQYRCVKTGSNYVWSPAVETNTCIPVVEVTTASTTSVTQPATTTAIRSTGQPGATSTVSLATPRNEGDDTAIIILSVILGVVTLVLIAAVAFYFISIKPKLNSLAPAPNTGAATSGTEMTETSITAAPRANPPADDKNSSAAEQPSTSADPENTNQVAVEIDVQPVY